MHEQPTSDDVFALFEYILSSARLRLRAEAKPIAFELGHGERWVFDPRSDDAQLFRKSTVDPPAGALKVSCGADLLARLVTDDDFVLRDEDDASFEGDIEDLLVLANVLDEKKSALGIRTTSLPSRGGK